MPLYLVAVQFAGTTGLPEDVYVNDFVWETAGAIDQAEADDITDILDASFYNNNTPAAEQISDYMSPNISRAAGGVKVDFYDITADLAGTPHGSPVVRSTFTLGASTGDAIPEEVSAVVSYHSDLTGVLERDGATRPAARRRGRLYIGPLAHNAYDSIGGKVLLSLVFQSALIDGATRLLADAGGLWMQWSRADAFVRPVEGGFIDNAFDTQRRRGAAPNGRTTFGS